MRRSLRPLESAILLALLAGSSLPPVQASPDVSGRIPGAARFPRGAVINVFIIDPNPAGTRDADAEAGLLRWKSQLQSRGLDINVQVGNPPAGGAQNEVDVTFVPPSSLPNDSSGQKDDGFASNKFTTKQEGGHTVADQITSGTIMLNNTITDSTTMQNLAMHELTHVLGFADDPTEPDQPHNAMDHGIDTSKATSFTDVDKAELDVLYPLAQNSPPQSTIQPSVQHLPDGNFEYTYQVTSTGGPAIPFIQITTNGAPVTNITANGLSLAGTSGLAPNPDGYFFPDPRNPASFAGFMEDTPFPTQDPQSNLDFLTFVDERSPLGQTRLTDTFAFESPAPPGTVLVYASGTDFTAAIGPGSVPEPRSLITAGIGLLVVAALAWSRRSAG